MTDHATTVLILGDGRYRALCSCGMKGIRTPNRSVAEAQAEQHLAYVREVAALTDVTAPVAGHEEEG